MSPTEFRADLHCHSLFSDGTLSPDDLVHLAIKNKLSGLSITDHDSVSAYPAACAIAEENNLLLIPGVEFSSTHKKTSVHVLGYAFAHNHPAIAALCAKHKERRNERNLMILENLKKKKGLLISEEELMDSSLDSNSVGRPHIALAMMRKGYVGSIQDAFKLYLGDGKPCFAPGKNIGVEETLEAIHAAKGLAVIAHPHLLKNQKVFNDLLKMPFDGIECYYSKFTKNDNEKWLKIAEKKDLFATGGSDFHGETKPGIVLGCSWVDEKCFMDLFRHYKDNL